MICYVYDNTFDGLLTCIYEAYYRHEDPDDIVPMDSLDDNFLIQRYHIQTDGEKAAKVYRSIEEKISEDALKTVFYAFLSELPMSGKDILNYLRVAYKIGRNINDNLSNDAVLKISKIEYKVGAEKHRLLGLLRFKVMESGILYASIEPDHNVSALLAPHFSERMANENWIIHDIRRNIGVFYNKKEWIVREFAIEEDIIFHEAEEDYQEMWKAYYKHMAIESRKNLRLKKNHMPMRYWKHLVEI